MTSNFRPAVSSLIGKCRGAHSAGSTGACEFHNCSHDPRSYMILTTTLGLPSLTIRSESSLKTPEMVVTLFEGLNLSAKPLRSRRPAHCQ